MTLAAKAADNGKKTTVPKEFDDLDGKFVARLREIASTTRTTAEGKATITFKTARIEAPYLPEVIKKIEAGRLIAIPNVMGVGVGGANNSYSIYEIADVYPMHYSMLTLDRSQPGAIRKEFMTMIEKEWQTGSKSTWIEIVAAPTGYAMVVLDGSESKFTRKSTALLTGAQVHLLSKETIEKFICYAPKNREKAEEHTIGHLLGVTEPAIPFTVNVEKLLHYHAGVFAFTGSGKSNFTSLIMRKAMRTVPKVKFVVFDVSSEYGINVLDLLRSYPSRLILTEELRGKMPAEQAKDYLRRHVVPESLAEKQMILLVSIEELVKQNKIRSISIESEAEQTLEGLSTFAGLLGALGDLAGEKYGAAAQKVLIPTVAAMIRRFMREKGYNEDAAMSSDLLPALLEIEKVLLGAKLRADAAILSLISNLKLVIENPIKTDVDAYDSVKLVREIMDPGEDSPKVFVVNLPEADVARTFCAEIINRVFRYRKNSFTLDPRVVFVFDEAQEFIPAEKKRDDGTEYSSRAVERLLRHGRKYFLHGWISTQRIAHLNTNALQQLHSYFVSTMPRPYDRQLVSDTFAIDDAFVERTLMFQNGDWLMTSFKATNTQNVPVFFHALNNEDYILV